MNKSNRRKMIISFLVEHSGKVGAPGSFLLIAILWVFYERAESILVITPTNKTVFVNQSTFFNCSKSGNKSEQLTWHHYAVDGKGEGVFETGSIRGAYIGRFDIDKNITSGTFNLLVQRPEPSDAGRYVCLEDPLEKDPGASAELTVLDSDLVCVANMALHEIIGSTQCDKTIPSDEPLLSCSVTYSGNIAPQIKWRNDEMASESMKTECNTTGNRVMCNRTLNTNLIKDGSVFVCQLATAKQYNCSLKVNRTIYTFSDNFIRNITMMDEASCFANTSAELSCSYKWHMDNQTVQLGQKLKTNKSGIYRCEAECKIRNETCAFTAKHINILESALAITSSWNREWMWLLIIPVAALAVLAYFVWKKRRAARALSNGIAEYQQVQGPIHQQQQPSAQSPVPSADIDPANKALLSAPSSTEPITVQEPVHQSLQPLVQSPGPSADIEPVHEALLTVPSNPEQDENYSDDAIRKTFNDAKFIGSVSNGAEIRGPMQWEDIQCTCGRISCTEEEVEMGKEQDICTKCHKWMELKHKNLIMFSKVILNSPSVYILMEYTAGGSVRAALRKCTKCQVNLEMPVIKNWATQIAEGMDYLHQKNVVHKNLNSIQIFIMESFEASDILNSTLKISQFRLIDDDHTVSHAETKFSFAAPEVFLGIFGKEGDVWSFGIVIWEMLTKRMPYKEEQAIARIRADIREGANHLRIPDECPKKLKTILEDCRRLELSERPTFNDLVESLQAWQI